MDDGRKTDGGRSQSQISMTQARGGGSESGQATSQVKKESKTVSKPKKEPPLCPFHVCCSENPPARHYIRDCHKSSQAEKEKMFAKLKADKERDAPAFSTRSKKEESNTKPVKSEPRPAGNVGRLADDRDIPDPRPTCKVAIADGLSSLDITGRCDDGSDDTVASRKVAEAAVIDVIGRIAKINPVELSVALKKGVDAYKFRFSRAWTVPRTTMHLPSGKLAMMNLSFLVAEGELACENIIIGRSVLEHLSIDTAMLLDRNRQLLDDTDCSAVGNPTVLTGAVFVSRVMTARSNSIPNELLSDPNICKLDPARPRAVFDYQWIEDDPFPNPTLLDMVDSDQSVEVHLEVEATLERSKAAGITIFLGMDPTGLLTSFKRTKPTTVVDASTAMDEINTNLSTAKKIVSELHPIVKDALASNRNVSREATSRGKPAQFTEGDFVLVTRDEFFKGEKLALHWRGPRRVLKAVSNYFYTVEDLRIGSCSDIHARRLRF